MPPPMEPSPYQKIAMDDAARFCPSCGGIGEAKTEPRGSGTVEIVLWLLLCLPGLIYSIWRRKNKLEMCSYCGKDGVLLPDSPQAKQILAGKSSG